MTNRHMAVILVITALVVLGVVMVGIAHRNATTARCVTYMEQQSGQDDPDSIVNFHNICRDLGY